MGNSAQLPTFYTNTYSERNLDTNDRRYRHRAEYIEEDPSHPWRSFLHDWKHSRLELPYFSYRVITGMLAGAFLGASVIHPLTRHSPYLFRKLIINLRPSELSPLNNTRMIFRHIVLPYAVVGGISGFLISFTSLFFDKVFDCNKATKYLLVGTIDGWIIGKVFGNPGWASALAFLGFVTGAALFTGHPKSYLDVKGDTGRSVEYMPHVKPAQMKRWEIQEARIMGGSAEYVLNKKEFK